MPVRWNNEARTTARDERVRRKRESWDHEYSRLTTTWTWKFAWLPVTLQSPHEYERRWLCTVLRMGYGPARFWRRFGRPRPEGWIYRDLPVGKGQHEYKCSRCGHFARYERPHPWDEVQHPVHCVNCHRDFAAGHDYAPPGGWRNALRT